MGQNWGNKDIIELKKYKNLYFQNLEEYEKDPLNSDKLQEVHKIVIRIITFFEDFRVFDIYFKNLLIKAFKNFAKLEKLYVTLWLPDKKIHRDHILHSLRTGLLSLYIYCNSEEYWKENSIRYMIERYFPDWKGLEAEKLFKTLNSNESINKKLGLSIFLLTCIHDQGYILEFFRKNNTYDRCIKTYNRLLDEFSSEERVFQGVSQLFIPDEDNFLFCFQGMDSGIKDYIKNDNHKHDKLSFIYTLKQLIKGSSILEAIDRRKHGLEDLVRHKINSYGYVDDLDRLISVNFGALFNFEFTLAIGLHEEKNYYYPSPFFRILYLSDNLQEWGRSMQTRDNNIVRHHYLFKSGVFEQIEENNLKIEYSFVKKAEIKLFDIDEFNNLIFYPFKKFNDPDFNRIFRNGLATRYLGKNFKIQFKFDFKDVKKPSDNCRSDMCFDDFDLKYK